MVDSLEKSREVVGYLYPIVRDAETGEIVDGLHRYEADPKWPEETRKFRSEKERLLFRLHSNLFRRRVSAKERASQLIRLARILEGEGIPKERIAQEIVRLVPGLSQKYILRLLPSRYKTAKRREAARVGVVKRLYEKEKRPEGKAKKPEVPPKFYNCPVCGTRLVLKGELLWQA